MLSLVSVFNDPAKLATQLLRGQRRQRAAHQLVLVDNSDARFDNAATALNWGARQATGDWIVFLHQDVELLGADWLQRAEIWLRGLDKKGWHGVVGRTHAGRWRGLLRDRDMVFGEPFDEPVEVQTLDEVVLIHANRGTDHCYFDEGVPGWHAYGVEACCRALRVGGRNFVLPLPIWHQSNSTNRAGLREAHAYVWAKHRTAFAQIYTTCGVLPHPYGWSGSYKVATFLRRVRGLWHFSWLRRAAPGAFQKTPWEVLEALTRNEPEVHCFHGNHWVKRLEGRGFTDRTEAPRRVIHHFVGLPPADVSVACAVLAPDLSADSRSFADHTIRARRLIVAMYLEPGASPTAWRKRLRRDFFCHLAMEPDETRWAILEVEPSGGIPAGLGREGVARRA